jgi:HAD superfamily hydrolase (TIGR01484 family)
MIKYKALMSDVDGTLVASARHALPTQKVKDAISTAKDLIHIGVATGRPTFGMKYLSEYLDLSGPSIVSGGAQVIDSSTQTVLWEKALDTDDIQHIAALTQDYPISFPYEGEDIMFDPKKHTGKILEMAVQGVETRDAERIVSDLSHLSTIAIHTVSSWTEGKIDVLITHAQATKQHGIYEVAKILNIDPSEIIGVGDGGNDFPLLMACGLKVAMGNASDELKAIADYIAPPVDEDGLAHVIEKFILNR